MHGGPHGTMDSIRAMHPAAQGSIPGIPPKKIQEIVDVAEVNQWC